MTGRLGHLPAAGTTARGRDVSYCLTCSQPLPPAVTLCGCGHPDTSHELTARGRRTFCCHMGPAGACGCQRFEGAPCAAET